jgi:hypothetical protein
MVCHWSLPLAGQDSSPSSQSQPRQTYVRQDSDASQRFYVPRKPLQPRPEFAQESGEPLLGNDGSKPILINESWTSEPVDEHRDPMELQDLMASAMAKTGNSSYGRLPSR